MQDFNKTMTRSMYQIVLISMLFVGNFINICCSQDCDIRWTSFDGFSYKVFQNKRMTFDEAESYCATFTHGYLQSHLASIHNLDEHTFVVDLCKHASNGTFYQGGYWIGLNGNMKNGVHRWTDGSNFDFYQWGPNQPNSENLEQYCGKVWLYYTEWFDGRCWNELPFVCKRATKNH